MKPTPKIKTINPKAFENENGIYIFPFKVLDDTPGGSNLGRIEWNIEAIRGNKNKGRYYIEKLLIYATQTHDERYGARNIFEIPCFSESISGDCLNRESFLNYVWRIMPCEMHKTFVLSAYPGNQHKELIIDVGSSIGIDIDFK